jgi:hypothetical protein
MSEAVDHKQNAAERLCRLIIGLTHDESFSLQCEAMLDLRRAVPHVAMCPSFIKWEQYHTGRLKRGNEHNRAASEKHLQMLLNL